MRPMRLLILGGTGMLGHKLWQEAADPLEAWATVRGTELSGPAARIIDPLRVVTEVAAEDLGSIERALEESGADAVVNCIGIIKQSAAAVDPIPSITVNSLFPQQVAAICRERGVRMIHISTDCVFAGTKGMYSEDDPSDALDLYGRSKFLGEVAGPGALTVRTSIIGRELGSSFGLVEWFLGEAGGTVRGFEKAIFSGFTTQALARILIEILTEQPRLEGLWQVSAEPIDKFRLLQLVRDAYGVEVEIAPDTEVRIDRSLDSSRFRAATGWSPPGWEQMIEQMASDSTPYEKIRRSVSAGR
jgi:dTDP-4-dehydrorhamnose reductase